MTHRSAFMPCLLGFTLAIMSPPVAAQDDIREKRVQLDASDNGLF